MFQFPGFASCNYTFIAGLLSFLIQKSPDRSLVADSPELIAGSHVFHRFLMPRHPPCTLSNLTTFIDHRQKDSADPATRIWTQHANFILSNHRAGWLADRPASFEPSRPDQ